LRRDRGINMKKKIVLLKTDYSDSRPVEDDGDLSYYTDQGYVILTEAVEIDFPELPKEVVVNNEIASIDKKITEIMAKSEASITVLKTRKQELLAIGHES